MTDESAGAKQAQDRHDNDGPKFAAHEELLACRRKMVAMRFVMISESLKIWELAREGQKSRNPQMTQITQILASSQQRPGARSKAL
jgi:hypothetical protein